MKGDSLLLKIMVDKNKNNVQDKQQCDRSSLFSVEQMVFLRALVGKQDPPNSESGKGKEIAKMYAKEMD